MIKRTHNSLQSRRDMMFIGIIGVLLHAGGVFCSLPIQGLISMTHDNTMSNDLYASKSNVNADLDELIKKLREMKKPRIIHLIIDLEREAIEINNETDLKQDYDEVNFNKMILKLTNNSVENNIKNVLRRIFFLMQEHKTDETLTHQNSISHKILRYVVSEEDSIDLNKNYVPSWILSNPEFVHGEMERLILRSELSLEYAKSVQNILLWLIKLLDTKLQQLHHDFDYISRWRLLNLQKQVEFLLENLTTDNQQQHGELKDNEHNLENEHSSIPNIEKIEIEEVILTEQDKRNLTETKINEDRTEDNKDKTFTVKIPINSKLDISTDDNYIINSTVFAETKTPGNEDLRKNETSLEFSQLNNVSSISLSENITGTLQEIDQSENNAVLQGSMKNVTDTQKTPSFRRTLQVLIPTNKNKQQKQTEDIGKHHYFNKRREIKSDSASAMDEILEAVDEVLPTDKTVEISPKG